MVSTWKSVGVSGFPIVIVSARFAPAPTVLLLLAGAAAVVIINSETKIANDWSVGRHRMSIHDFPSLRLPLSRPAWPCAAPCPSHCIGSPSEAFGRRPYNLYAIRRRWKKVWVSTDPLPQKPTRPISIYIPRSRSVSTFLSEGNEVVQPTITSFSWFHNMLKELLQRLSIPYTLPEIKHG
jgi:hypothetical protein